MKKRIKLPILISSRQVSELMGIDRKNVYHQRRTKGFPEPIVIIDKFPLWLESDILEWKSIKECKRP